MELTHFGAVLYSSSIELVYTLACISMAVGTASILSKLITKHIQSKKEECNRRKIPKIMLWTAPRCVSTAFERAIIEVPHCKVFHEPFSTPYYFGAQKVSRRYKEDAADGITYEQTADQLIKPYEDDENIDFVFSKDMAYAVTQYKPHYFYSHLLSTMLSSFTHTFLIRRPDKVIVSLYKASLNEELTGWNYFDPKEVGFDDIYMIYTRCLQLGFDDIVIIDADDLLTNPAKIMKLYCDAVGIKYSDEMLSWKPGPVEAFQLWEGWHDDVINSSGFKETTKEELEAKEVNLQAFQETLSKEVQEEIKKAFVIYNDLYSKRLH